MQLAVFLPAFLVLLGPLAAMVIVLRRKAHRRTHYRSPLTSDLMRTAGSSVRKAIERLRDQVDEYLFLLVTIPVALYAIHLTQSYLLGTAESVIRSVLLILITLTTIIYLVRKLARITVQVERMRLGAEAEEWVGQQLDRLMRQGAYVFHDVPFDAFNVDHVVISAGGIFAVETKGRAKPRKGGRHLDATVTFDGACLQFPGWTERRPVDQAESQARSLQQWLSNAVGEPLSVSPVLAVAGWFVERRGPSAVLIYNGKNPDFLLNRRPHYSDQLLARIAHQIEQRCRSIEPSLKGPPLPQWESRVG